MSMNDDCAVRLPESNLSGRVLLVDDEESIRKAVRAILSDEGCSVHVCANGESALEVLEHERFDVVVSDIRMPGISGLDLLAHLHHHFPEIPVLLISGYADLETAVAAVKEHAFDFIMKPFHPDHIIASVRKAFEHKRLLDMEREYMGLLEETLMRSAVEVRQYLQQLKEARDEALEASRLKSQFMATMSHEIRTPLNGIVGLIDLLQYKEQLPHQKEYFSMLKEAAEYLTSLLGNILDFSKLSSEPVHLEEKTFSLRELLASVSGMARVRAQKKGLTFNETIGDDIPDSLWGDETRLSQVLLNFLDNALKFTSSGSISLHVCKVDGQLAESPESITLRFAVADTGPGVDMKQQRMIFDSFTQGDASFTKQHGGIGLGLSIAQQIVNAMGGSMGVSSEPEHGSIFYFTVTMHTGGAEHENTYC